MILAHYGLIFVPLALNRHESRGIEFPTASGRIRRVGLSRNVCKHGQEQRKRSFG